MIRSCFAVALLVTSLGADRASTEDACPGVVDGICVDGVCTPYNEFVCPLAENQCNDYLDRIANDAQYEEVYEALTEPVGEPCRDVAELTSGHDEVYDAEVYGVESTELTEVGILENSASEVPVDDKVEAPAIEEYDYDEYYEYDEDYYENYVPEPYEASNEDADETQPSEVEPTVTEEEADGSYYDDHFEYDDYWYDEIEQYNDESSTDVAPAAETSDAAIQPASEEVESIEVDPYQYDYDYDDYWYELENEVAAEHANEEIADDRDYWADSEEPATSKATDEADIYDNFYEEFYYDEDYDDFWFEDHQPEAQEEEDFLLHETDDVVDDSLPPAKVEAAFPLTHAIVECIRQSSLGPVMPEWTQDATDECGMPPLADAVKDDADAANDEVVGEALEEYGSWDGWDCWEDDCHDPTNEIVTQEKPAVGELLNDGRKQVMLTLARMLDGASDVLESASLSLTQMAGENVTNRPISSENQQR